MGTAVLYHCTIWCHIRMNMNTIIGTIEPCQCVCVCVCVPICVLDEWSLTLSAAIADADDRSLLASCVGWPSAMALVGECSQDKPSLLSWSMGQYVSVWHSNVNAITKQCQSVLAASSSLSSSSPLSLSICAQCSLAISVASPTRPIHPWESRNDSRTYQQNSTTYTYYLVRLSLTCTLIVCHVPYYVPYIHRTVGFWVWLLQYPKTGTMYYIIYICTHTYICMLKNALVWYMSWIF